MSSIILKCITVSDISKDYCRLQYASFQFYKPEQYYLISRSWLLPTQSYTCQRKANMSYSTRRTSEYLPFYRFSLTAEKRKKSNCSLKLFFILETFLVSNISKTVLGWKKGFLNNKYFSAIHGANFMVWFLISHIFILLKFYYLQSVPKLKVFPYQAILIL